MQIPLTPLDFARRARKLYGDREAVVDGAVRFTYAQFFDRCDRWAAALHALGVKPGDRVAYIAPNTHAQLESFYAVPRLGAVLVPLNYRLIADDFEYLIHHSGASIVCVHADYLQIAARIRPRLPEVEHWVALEGQAAGFIDYEAVIGESSGECPPMDISESDLLSINYTSGTTSRPKGVMITHRNAYLNSIGTLVHHPMTPADRYLWTLPMFHANGWTFVWTVTAVGGVHVCLRKVDPPSIFGSIHEERVTMLCAAPTVLIGIANAPESLRRLSQPGLRVMTAGAPPAPATIQCIEGELGWKVTQAYGLTETSPFISVCEPRPEHATLSQEELATIKVRQGVELITSGELRVVNADGKDVAADGCEMGEIIARGNVIMEGYYNDASATAQAIRDGWFHTGDSAVVHPDGYIEIRDRLKDVIISGGENISSIEVEGALMHHPAVLECAVVGQSDPIWGETPHAFVVLRPGTNADPQELREFLRSRLAHFKVPREVTFVANLPKTATGKLQKFVLRGGPAPSAV